MDFGRLLTRQRSDLPVANTLNGTSCFGSSFFLCLCTKLFRYSFSCSSVNNYRFTIPDQIKVFNPCFFCRSLQCSATLALTSVLLQHSCSRNMHVRILPDITVTGVCNPLLTACCSSPTRGIRHRCPFTTLGKCFKATYYGIGHSVRSPLIWESRLQLGIFTRK